MWLHCVIDAPVAEGARAAAFWSAVLGWPDGPSWPGHGELRSFEPVAGAAYVHLQQIIGPPGVHLDVETTNVDTTSARAVELGAVRVSEQRRWRTLRSPGGLPFCVVKAATHDAPEPVQWPAGHRSRLVQVCVDSPRAAHDREVAFWRDLLGPRWVDSTAPEFAGKWHDDAGSPLQLLFQRLDEPDGQVRAHLDLGTDDVTAVFNRLRALGAEPVGPGRGWYAMRDAMGLPFCATGNSPEATRTRHLG
jgi:hypothetical protein